MLRVRSAGLQRIARQLLQHAEQSQAALVHLPTFAEDRQSAAATPLTPPQHWSLQRRAYASPASFKVTDKLCRVNGYNVALSSSLSKQLCFPR